MLFSLSWLLGVYIAGGFSIVLVTLATTTYFVISDIRLPIYQLSLLLGVIPTCYVLARLSLIFPATAVDQRPNIKWAWGKSFNNGWRLVVIVGLLPFVTSFAQQLMKRENSTMY